jgi:iron complex outermembrane recepter protein
MSVMNGRLIQISKLLLTSALTTTLMGLGAAYAQDEGQPLETVVVSGVRGSMLRSMDMKARAATIVDAISSEELGKFPDRNVADALANIPGVTVSRGVGAEGETVTIRGLGEEFSITTLNGRILPSDSTSRAFAFDVLPSEMISGAEIRKAIEASQLEGSIGGAIDMRTARPFDNPGMHLYGSAEGEYEDLPGQMGYKVTGVFSDTFNNDHMGLLLSAVYGKRKIRTDTIHESSPVQMTEADDNVDYNGNGIIESDTGYIRPSFYSVGVYLAQFERVGLSGSFQYQPVDNLTITFDALYSYYNNSTDDYAQSNSLSPRNDPTSPLKWDMSTVKIDKNNVITNFTENDQVAEVLDDEQPRIVHTQQYGTHATWLATSKLSVDVDAYWARAAHNEGGKNRFVVAGIPGSTATFAAKDYGLPDLKITIPGGRSLADATDADYHVHYIGIQGENLADEILGAKFDTKYTLNWGPLAAVQVGFNYNRRAKSSVTYDNADTTSCNYCGYPFTFADMGAQVIRPLNVGNLLSSMKGDFPRNYARFDIDTYLASLSKADNNPNILDPNTNLPYPAGYSTQIIQKDAPLSFAIAEKTFAGYLQADFAGSNWEGNIGLRIVSTDVTSHGSTKEILSIVKRPGNQADYDVTVSDPTPVTGGGDYTKFLPSFNFSYSFTDELRLRLAGSQVIARPSFDQLSPASDTSSAASGTFIIYNSGNPNLKPTEANQLDASLEWYRSKQGSLSFAVFYKDISQFVTTVNEAQQIAGQNFTVVTVQNGDSATVMGMELGGQYLFENGFGVQANLTYNHSKAHIGDLTGQLDGAVPISYNLKAFYQKDEWEGQVSYGFTSSFTKLISGFIPGLPEKQLHYQEMTASLAYAITGNLKVYVEGSNLLDSATQSYQGYPNVPGHYEYCGRSFFAGVRASL